ncbi:MAG TPA: AMP-binding protein, partial [Ilumatobacteraceae bacterium]|nr:AMP-binding protein [Ilumatobacteraceae bacterium]
FPHVCWMTRPWDELEHRITSIIAPTPWKPDVTLQLLESQRITVCQGVPTQYRMLLDHPDFAATDLSTLRIAGVGASRVPPDLVAEMRDKLGCPVVHRYASTEGSVATGTRLDDDPVTIATTVGRPNGDVQLKIVDDDGNELPPNERGTICLKTRAMMRGYWEEPERTAEAIDADGWLHTGDLGWIGDDGNLRIAGRRTEMYIRGGYNVYPIEVENLLADYPGIAQAAIIGCDVADRLGEIGVLIAVPHPGATLDIIGIRSFVKERLADYKAPDVLVTTDEFPLTSIGKINKVAMKPLADQAAAQWRRP